MTPKDIETLWDNFVPRIGGRRVLEIVGQGVTFANADYVFSDDNIVAELKVLSTDLLRTNAGQDAIGVLMDKWRAEGLINFRIYGTRLIRSSDLPKQCQLELASHLGKRLLRVIRDANDQIKSTKAHLGMNDAHGLLLLVNDGAYHLSADMLRFTLTRALRPRHDREGKPTDVPNKSIDNVVALTIGMPSQTPGIPVPTQLWLPAFRDSRQISEEFSKRLAEGWFNYVADVIGGPVPVYSVEDPKVVFGMKFTEQDRKPAEWSKKK